MTITILILKRYKMTIFLLIAFFTFSSIISIAQNTKIDQAKLIRINDKDTTYFTRVFEVDINKRKIFVINPVMNYLDIKGGKPKYRVKLKRIEWNKIEQLISEINLSDYKEKKAVINDYSLTLYFKDSKVKTYTTATELELFKLKEIIKTIRER